MGGEVYASAQPAFEAPGGVGADERRLAGLQRGSVPFLRDGAEATLTRDIAARGAATGRLGLRAARRARDSPWPTERIISRPTAAM